MIVPEKVESPKFYKLQIVWRNVVLYIIYHFIALQAIYYILTLQIHWKTVAWAFTLLAASGQGICSGVHRLWSHRSYKAKLPLKLILALLQTLSFQNSIYEWARDHRVHHKFTDTDADPHNANRGFFFSHMGWLMVRKHPDVITKGKTVDMSDLEADPVVYYQRKYYAVLAPTISLIIPSLVPWYCWNENFYVAFITAGMLKMMVGLHFTWLVNSAAHMYGTKPFDKAIKPTQNWIVSKLSQGEGWHNYHHCFPWDYRASELDKYNGNLNLAFIDLMAKIGWAYELKTASSRVIKGRILKSGQKRR